MKNKFSLFKSKTSKGKENDPIIDFKLMEFVINEFDHNGDEIKNKLEELKDAIEKAIDSVEDKSSEYIKLERDFKLSEKYRQNSIELYGISKRIQNYVNWMSDSSNSAATVEVAATKEEKKEVKSSYSKVDETTKFPEEVKQEIKKEIIKEAKKEIRKEEPKKEIKQEVKKEKYKKEIKHEIKKEEHKKEINQQIKKEEPKVPKKESVKEEKKEVKFDLKTKRTLSDDLTGKIPVGFEVRGYSVCVEGWQDLMVKTADTLTEIYRNTKQDTGIMQAISSSKEEAKPAKKRSPENESRDTIKEMLKDYFIPATEYKIYVK